MIIDIHTHIYPDKIAQATVSKLAAGPGLDPASDGTASGLINHMKNSGVDMSVLMPVATNPLKVDKLNDYAAGFDGSNGLVSFGAMHPDCEYWKDELSRIKDKGLKGIKIHPVYQNTDIDDARYLRIFERCAELDLFVLTHSGRDIGFPDAYRCTPEQILNALKLTGGFKLICAHMGGWEMWDRVLELLPGTGVYLDTAFSLGTYAYTDNPGRDPHIASAFGSEGRFIDDEMFIRFVNAFGADRILFGSDSPWEAQSKGIDIINKLPLDNESKRLILGGNAQRLFGFTPRT